jgi:DNA-directed RNA polymerase subunit RPC12/RpoP
MSRIIGFITDVDRSYEGLSYHRDCGAVFIFKMEDVKYDKDVYEFAFYVTCPNCGHNMIIKSFTKESLESFKIWKSLEKSDLSNSEPLDPALEAT